MKTLPFHIRNKIVRTETRCGLKIVDPYSDPPYSVQEKRTIPEVTAKKRIKEKKRGEKLGICARCQRRLFD